MPIDPRQQALWDRMVAHWFDDPAARLTFTARLARENGSAIGHAVRMVHEYRRFGFLVIGCVLLAAISVLALARKPRRTRQGDAVVHGA